MLFLATKIPWSLCAGGNILDSTSTRLLSSHYYDYHQFAIVCDLVMLIFEKNIFL